MKRDFDRLVTLAILVAAGYLVYKFTSVANTLDEKRKAIGSAIGETLYDWLHPRQGEPMVTWLVLFPDGKYKAVNSESVDGNGYFTYFRDGTKWRLAVGESGKKVAIPA